jgi:hypothetical protein
MTTINGINKKTPRNTGKKFTLRASLVLMDLAGIKSAASIATRLGRTTKSIRRKAEKLGLSLRVN